ncbi:MAG: flagellar hook protein FlgE [Gammaproteobacteria bacterium]|nr:flagellar hook protein FlgE [Gammaproteobacteria bacterium]
MSFQSAISGLRASSTDLGVVGNNVANANTTAFKASRAEFSDVFATTSAGVAATATGQGVNTAKVAQQFTQGNITFTDNGLDLAISGNGFFVVDSQGDQLYSRDGSFGIDREGYMVNGNGQRLKAFSADGTGAISGALETLRITSANTAPVATTNVEFGANLDSQDTAPSVTPFDATNNATFNSTTATTVYDSLGGSHLLQLYFVKTGSGTWDTNSQIDGAAVGAGSPLAFNTSGALSSPLGGSVTLPAFVPVGGGAPLNISLNVSEMTQYGAPFAVNRVTQDGYTTGRLSGLDIDKEGIVFARFTNGQSTVQGQVALANFANSQGLRSLGNNNWAESFESGAALMGSPSTGSFGQIQSGALEDANIDLSQELVNLIVAQRNFQANTQVIQAESAVTQAILQIS